MTYEDWREVMLAKRRDLEALRKSGANGEVIRAKRAEVIAAQGHIDILVAQQVAEYQRIAAESEAAQSAIIRADAASAVSEAERILGAKE